MCDYKTIAETKNFIVLDRYTAPIRDLKGNSTIQSQ